MDRHGPYQSRSPARRECGARRCGLPSRTLPGPLATAVILWVFTNCWLFAPRFETAASRAARDDGAGPPPNPGDSDQYRSAAGAGAYVDDIAALGGKENNNAHSQASRKSTIHVALTATESHLVGAVAVINSTVRAAQEPGRLRFHVIFPVTEEASWGRLRTLLAGTLGDGQLALVPWAGKGGKVYDTGRGAELSQPIVFARFHFADVLPQLDRVVYLDVDLVVLGDIAELWAVSLKGKVVGAVQRCRTRFKRSFAFAGPATNGLLDGFDKEECVFNNGVMVLDLAAWRRAKAQAGDSDGGISASRKGRDYSAELRRWVELNDRAELYSLGSQPPFNLVFYKDYAQLDPAWNTMDAGDPVIHPSPAETRKAKVLHWNGASPPWRTHPRTLYSEHFTRFVPDWELLADPTRFTMVIATTGARSDALIQVVEHVSKSPWLHEVLLVWNNPADPCPALLLAHFQAGGAPLRCLPQRENDVQNRLLVAEALETEAVLHHDDDAQIRLSDLELGFKVWKRHQRSVVGFQPRVIRRRAVSTGADDDDGLREASWEYGFHLTEGYYSFVIGKFFYVSRSLMRTYAADRGLVQANRGRFCEDVAINFVAALPGNGGSIVVESEHWELETPPATGLSTRIDTKKWAAARSKCFGQMAARFDRLHPDWLEHYPRQTQVVTGYDPNTNHLVYRDVIPLESICADTSGVRACRVPRCTEVGDRKPCY